MWEALEILNAGYARDAQLAQLAQLDSLAAAEEETHTRRAAGAFTRPILSSTWAVLLSLKSTEFTQRIPQKMLTTS